MLAGQGMAYWKLSMCAAVAWGAALGTSGTLAQQFNSEQIQMINETAASICNTVKEAKGQKSDFQIQGDVNAKLGGLLGKVADIGGSGKGALTREEFEGLSRDATATALQGDRDCRERLFNKMFDKLNAAPDPRPASISGRWRDNLGFVSEIEQTGTSFTFTVQGATSCLFQPFRSTGEGSIRGQDIKSTYRSSIGSHGDCEGIISSDGYAISSRCRDSVCGYIESTSHKQ
jgi:hypothetical protein